MYGQYLWLHFILIQYVHIALRMQITSLRIAIQTASSTVKIYSKFVVWTCCHHVDTKSGSLQAHSRRSWAVATDISSIQSSPICEFVWIDDTSSASTFFPCEICIAKTQIRKKVTIIRTLAMQISQGMTRIALEWTASTIRGATRDEV